MLFIASTTRSPGECSSHRRLFESRLGQSERKRQAGLIVRYKNIFSSNWQHLQQQASSRGLDQANTRDANKFT